MASSFDSNMQDLITRCEKLGWQTTKMATGKKVRNPNGETTTIGYSSNGRNYANALARLNRIGFEAAEKRAAEAAEVGRQQRIADDRAKVAAPPAAFLPPGPPTAPPIQVDGRQIITVAPGEMYAVTELITPERARELLNRPPARLDDGREVRQRPLDQNHVLHLAGILERGEWVLTPQGVSVAPDGGVIDGQHRLNAIELAKVSAPMRITYNVPAETFYAHDSGKKRTDANHLFTHGHVNTHHLHSAAKLMHCWGLWLQAPDGPMSSWWNWSRQKVSYPQIEGVLARWPEMPDRLTEGSAMVRQVVGIPGAATAFLLVTRRAIDDNVRPESEAAHWHERLDKFIEQVRLGEMISASDPAYTLREWIRRGSGTSMGGKAINDKRERQLLGMLKAWRNFATGQPMKIVKFSENEQMILPYVPRHPAQRAKAA